MIRSRSIGIVIAGMCATIMWLGPLYAQSPIIDNTVIVSSGLQGPVTMAFLGHNDFLVLEKSSGSVKRIQFPGPVITTVLQLTVNSGFEGGLLGIATHPDFDGEGYVYLFYVSATSGKHEVSRYFWNGSQFISRNLIWSLSAPILGHQGGIIAFGIDRKLYIVNGDHNTNSQTSNRSESPLKETACIIRLNDDGSIPGDNPFSSVAGWEQIYAFGIRNSFGLAIDPVTGFLWSTENGESQYDEVNRVPPGFNSGWSRAMGPDYRAPFNHDLLVQIPGSAYLNPQFSWRDTSVPTAICFLHSPRWPPVLRGDCVVATYRNGNIIRLDMTEDRSEFLLTGGFADKVADPSDNVNLNLFFQFVPGVTDLKLGSDGYLYAVAYNTFKIHRMRPRFPMGDINRDQSVTDDDLPLFLDLILGNSADPQQITQADFDGDGSITGLDIQGFVDSLRLPN